MVSLNPSPEPAAEGIGADPYVEVGPFRVFDASRAQFVRRVVSAGADANGSPVHVYALHVGGLNERGNAPFVHAMHRAELVGADGGSVIVLAKLAGARTIERVATTDVGWEVLRGLAQSLGRPVRVALVGGPLRLAHRAGEVLAEGAPVQVVHTDHGYHQDWAVPLQALRASMPDVTLVGLGAPHEMVWCQRHRHELPGRLVLTCGGWFGHIVGDEQRAPVLLRHPGLEWIARVAQSPRRLAPRYARGLVSTAVLGMAVLRARLADQLADRRR